jgi:hypothetical protein
MARRGRVSGRSLEAAPAPTPSSYQIDAHAIPANGGGYDAILESG